MKTTMMTMADIAPATSWWPEVTARVREFWGWPSRADAATKAAMEAETMPTMMTTSNINTLGLDTHTPPLWSSNILGVVVGEGGGVTIVSSGIRLHTS